MKRCDHRLKVGEECNSLLHNSTAPVVAVKDFSRILRRGNDQVKAPLISSSSIFGLRRRQSQSRFAVQKPAALTAPKERLRKAIEKRQI
jgi:hypothetical protein